MDWGNALMLGLYGLVILAVFLGMAWFMRPKHKPEQTIGHGRASDASHDGSDDEAPF